jgi:cytochrome c556
MPMKRFATVLLFSVAVAGLGLVSQPKVEADDDACKTAGSCPLHDFMEKEVQTPMDAGDLKKVAEALEKVAAFVPDPKWNEGDQGWAKLAKDGVAAAKAGDVKPTGATCKSCHKAYRKLYKEKFRSKKIGG